MDNGWLTFAFTDGEIDLLGSKNEYAGQSEEAAEKKPKS